MAYSQTVVALGGIAHIPFIIGFFKFVEKKFYNRLNVAKSL